MRSEPLRTIVRVLGILTPLAALSAPSAAADLAPREAVVKIADAVLRDHPKPPPFNWGEGVLVAGMMRAHALTGQQRYLDFVRGFADHHQQQGIGPLLAKRGYCGHWGPGLALLELYETSHDKRHLDLAAEINQFMLHKAERTQDGGLSHFFGKPQLWVDTLDMCCPVFAHSSRIMKQPELQAEAIRQLEIFARHLQDPRSGLYYHMWDEKSGQHTPCFWSRGNGWVVLTYTEVLANETPGSPAFQRLAQAYRRQLASIVKLQDAKTGLWHTVLDAPDTYLETSGSAMFLYGMAECRRRRLLDLDTADAMRRAWTGLCTQIAADGRVVGVSGGTAPGDKQNYQARPLGTYTWGTGAMLMSACAYARIDGP